MQKNNYQKTILNELRAKGLIDFNTYFYRLTELKIKNEREKRHNFARRRLENIKRYQ